MVTAMQRAANRKLFKLQIKNKQHGTGKTYKAGNRQNFPEDDDTLYREMTVHMPRCYFPTR